MKQMPSAQFRTQYARLTEPTVVTVLGHVIGTWRPGPGRPDDVVEEVILATPRHLARENERLTDEVRRLKQELAARPVGGIVVRQLPPDFTVTNVDFEANARHARQATIDATLGKINRKTKGA